MDSDGTAMIVGACGETAGGFSYAGNAYEYDPTTGVLIQNLTSPSPQYAGSFGCSVAIYGDNQNSVETSHGEGAPNPENPECAPCEFHEAGVGHEIEVHTESARGVGLGIGVAVMYFPPFVVSLFSS
jgi:hypothetical protein